MAANIADCDRELGRFAAMVNHGTGFWRDAYIATRFAEKIGATDVRLLHPLPYPDFAIRIDGYELPFEATEAMRADRRRGDEYRQTLADIEAGLSTVRDHPYENWLTAERSTEMLISAAQKKAAKSYAAQCGLVIYLNDTEYGTDIHAIIDTFQASTFSAGQVFQSVHVMWSGRLFEVWYHMRPVFRCFE